jgi:geranylgeranyl reductase family protein
MERVDVLVAGAGPAGAATAILLARSGARVVLVDRATFPRDKPCGGGLTGRALRAMPVDPTPVVEDVVDRFELRLRYGRSFERASDTPLVKMTQRVRLDMFLVEEAAASGADVREATRITGVVPGDDSVEVRTTAGSLRTRVLVGADGANGVVARAVGLDQHIVRGVAFEGNAGWDTIPEARYRGRAVIELGTVPGGYGWVFPKGDHANLGVGGWEREGPRLRDHLVRLAEAHGITVARLTDVKGHRLPMRRLGASPCRGRVLLVGDAAGLVDPLSGDGMYEAFVSARLAAQAIRTGDLAGYATALSAALDRHAAASWRAKSAIDRSAAACFWAARSPGVFGVVAGLLRGDVAHPSEARGLARPPLRVLSRLARRGINYTASG